MIMLFIALVIASLSVGLSVAANARFRDEARLPMQWSLTGSVNWSAPRVIALSIIPALTIAILALYVVASTAVRPRPGQEGEVVPVLIGLGILSVAVHVAHLWLIGRTLRRRER